MEVVTTSGIHNYEMYDGDDDEAFVDFTKPIRVENVDLS